MHTLIRDIMEIRENESSTPKDRAREEIQEMRAFLSNLVLRSNFARPGTPQA